ncbi:MAG: ABC transporter substrate-binding protein [Actinomycetota bacterium]|nr:ABC transporter substrate-binding protein [Actinomycetota bacterium]
MRSAGARRVALAAIAVVSISAVRAPWPVDRASAAVQPTSKLVRVGFPAYDGTLTPYTFTLGYPFVTLIYDTLLWRDAQGIPQPWLARSVTSSDGGRRLTVQLRGGVRWQDGRPVTAADVAFTFRFVASHYQPRFTPELRDVQDVRVTGPLTVLIDLRHVSLGFDDQPLADMPILPEHVWRDLHAGRIAPPGLPVGSGPYRLVSADPKTGYVFRANRGYFEGQPRVEEIQVPIIRHEQALYTALGGGRVDMLPLALPAAAAAALGGVGIPMQTGPQYTGTALLLNLRQAPFDRVPARRAVAAALDLQRIVTSVGSAVSATQGYIHPASPWSSRATLQRFDLAAAKTAFRTLRLPLINVLAPVNDPVRLEAGRQVVLALSLAGAKALLVETPSAKIERAIGETGYPPAFQAAIESTPGLGSDDPDFLASVFGSDPRTAPLNFGGYRSARFDTLAARVAAAPDSAARHRAVGAELSLLATDVPSIPLFFSQGTFAYRPTVYNGWVFIKGNGILDKRSFLPGQTRSATGAGGANSGFAPAGGSSSGSVINVVNVLSVVALAVVVILAATALRLRRSTGRR